jgi:hypothetical protein
MDEKERSSLSVDIDKELLLKFKSMCVLREHTMSEEIEKMISDWVELNKGEPIRARSSAHKPDKQAQAKPAEQSPEAEDLSDSLEEQAEQNRVSL